MTIRMRDNEMFEIHAAVFPTLIHLVKSLHVPCVQHTEIASLLGQPKSLLSSTGSHGTSLGTLSNLSRVVHNVLVTKLQRNTQRAAADREIVGTVPRFSTTSISARADEDCRERGPRTVNSASTSGRTSESLI